jgi:hypothetical protein
MTHKQVPVRHEKNLKTAAAARFGFGGCFGYFV